MKFKQELQRIREACTPPPVPEVPLSLRSDEEKRQAFAQVLPELCQQAGLEYPPEITLDEAMNLYKLAMKTITTKRIDGGKLDWFRALPIDVKVKMCRNERYSRQMEAKHAPAGWLD